MKAKEGKCRTMVLTSLNDSRCALIRELRAKEDQMIRARLGLDMCPQKLTAALYRFTSSQDHYTDYTPAKPWT